MKSWRSLLALALVGIGLGVGAATLRERSARVAAHPGLALREGSRLLADGRLQPGRPATYGVFAAEVAERAGAALALVPSELRPALAQIDFGLTYANGVAPVHGLEYQRDSRSIVVGDGALETNRSVWLHELAHARVAGARPSGELALRLATAIEEGVADYFAAAVGKSPVLGAGEAQRDLRSPPRVGPSEWASLAFSGFDAHRMGWLLAAKLYARDPEGGSLLRDAVACLDGESTLSSAAESPAAVVDAFLAACPAQGRARLAAVLADWLPLELHSPEIPT